MSKSKKFILVLAGCLLAATTTTYALVKSDFLQEASVWSYQNCNKVSSTSRLNNTICFLLKSNSSNQIDWALQKDNNTKQQTSIDSLKTSAMDKSKMYMTNSPVVNSKVSVVRAEAFCTDANDILISGGFISTPDRKMHIASSVPGSETTGISSWVVEGFGEAPNGYTFQAFANCLRVD